MKAERHYENAVITKELPAPLLRLIRMSLLAAPHAFAMISTDALNALVLTGGGNRFIKFLFQFGVYGIFFISVVDSSFVPLPLPGVTDIMCVVLAARHTNPLLLIILTTAGSALGGYLSYQVGHRGGMAFLEKNVPKRILKRVTRWMENHAILAVLPPPMPLSPFVLAAGALKMSQRKFLVTFTVSRAFRHTAAVALGIVYGPQVLGLWARFSEKWATTILTVLWTIILAGLALSVYRLYKTSRSFRNPAEAEA